MRTSYFFIVFNWAQVMTAVVVAATGNHTASEIYTLQS